MNPQPPLDSDDHPQLPSIKIHNPFSPRHHHHRHSSSTPVATPTPTAGARRRIAVAVDLSDESSYAVRWTVENYIRPGDAVIILHVTPTSGLFGADWGPLSIPATPATSKPNANNTNWAGDDSPAIRRQQQQQLEEFDAFTAAKVAEFAKPLKEANIPYKIHIVKDHDMTERLCLEVERLGLSAVILGSRGVGAERKGSDGTLGSVSNYCLNHCVCPVVVVRDEKDTTLEGEDKAKMDNRKGQSGQSFFF